MITLLIAIYRAWPFRPHCNSRTGTHTFLCRLIVPHLDGTRCPAKDASIELCPNTHPGGE